MLSRTGPSNSTQKVSRRGVKAAIADIDEEAGHLIMAPGGCRDV